MPFLPDEHSTDRLLKNLAIDLMAQLDPADLRQFGWYQYRDFDHANTLVSTEFAADAFIYLSFDAHQSWRRNPKVLTAIIAFMRRYYRASPQSKDLLALKHLIEAKPLNPESIVEWFQAVYPPDPARP
jgi:hypothetical protein